MNFAKFLGALTAITALGLELPYWYGIDFVITWIWIEEINQPRKDAIRKV